jgi:hypothetical protein
MAMQRGLTLENVHSFLNGFLADDGVSALEGEKKIVGSGDGRRVWQTFIFLSGQANSD